MVEKDLHFRYLGIGSVLSVLRACHTWKCLLPGGKVWGRPVEVWGRVGKILGRWGYRTFQLLAQRYLEVNLELPSSAFPPTLFNDFSFAQV